MNLGGGIGFLRKTGRKTLDAEKTCIFRHHLVAKREKASPEEIGHKSRKKVPRRNPKYELSKECNLHTHGGKKKERTPALFLLFCFSQETAQS